MEIVAPEPTWSLTRKRDRIVNRKWSVKTCQPVTERNAKSISTESGPLPKKALEAGLVSRHTTADGTLVRANASFKSFVPIELMLDPEEYKKRLRSHDREDRDEPEDPGNRAVNFRGEKRSNRTHRSTTDPDCRYVSKGTSGTGAFPGYQVNGVMENRNRILLGIGVEIFREAPRKSRAAWRSWTMRSDGSGITRRAWVPTRGSSTKSSFARCCGGRSRRISLP